MSFVGRVGTRVQREEAANLAVGPLARRAVLACGVAAAAFPCRDEITKGAAAASHVLTSPGGVLSGYFQEPLPDWAASNPRAVVSSTFRYPPKLARAVRRMMDDGHFPPDVPAALEDLPKSAAILSDAWARVAAPGEPLAVAWETTAFDGETSTKLIDMTDRKYAKAILILCCHIRDHLAQAPDSDLALPPRGDYDEVGRTRFAPIDAEDD
jgi:hypothetical protein